MAIARYDEIADWYENEFLAYQRRDGERRPFADGIGIDQAIAELLGSGSGPCLEIGCGTGIYADRLRELGRTPIGIDLSAGMLGYAVDRLPVARADANRLPFPDHSVDTALGVMISSDLPAFAPVLQEANRVLRPGGTYLHVGVHPCFIGTFADRTNPEHVVIRPGYHLPGWTPAIAPDAGLVGTNGQVRDKVGAAHAPLADLLNDVVTAGFTIDRSFEGGWPTPITLSLLLTKTAAQS